MVVQDLVVAWENAYRRYETAMGNDVIDTSHAVAEAWQELAAVAELPWWLSAAVRSAAQAFEHQAEAWSWDSGEDPTASYKVVLPTQTGARRTCTCHQTAGAMVPSAVVAAARVPA